MMQLDQWIAIAFYNAALIFHRGSHSPLMLALFVARS